MTRFLYRAVTASGNLHAIMTSCLLWTVISFNHLAEKQQSIHYQKKHLIFSLSWLFTKLENFTFHYWESYRDELFCVQESSLSGQNRRGKRKNSLKEKLRTAVIIYVVTFMKYVIFTELNSLISSFWMSIVRVPRRPFLFSYEWKKTKGLESRLNSILLRILIWLINLKSFCLV